jgi:hypothetical protein
MFQIKAKPNPISTIAGFPKSLGSILVHSKTLQEKEKEALFEMIINSSNFETFLEILTKAVVYRELKNGDLIPAPHPKTSDIEYYIVQKCIITGRGFTAYYLNPCQFSTLPTIFTISGSNFHPSGLDALSSYVNDFSFYIGTEAIDSGIGKVNKLLSKVGSFDYITGHSLGGTLAQYITSKYPNKIGKLVTYNSPGVPEFAHFTFLNNIKKHKWKPTIHIYQTAGDVVQSVNGIHLGVQISQYPMAYTRFSIGDLFTVKHTYLCLSNPSLLDITIKVYNRKFKNSITIQSSDINYYLNDYTRNFIELTRKIFGLQIYTCCYVTRVVSRGLFGSRVDLIKKI